MGLNNNIEKQILGPKRPHDAYDMNVKVNSVWGNVATKEKKSERPKVCRSTMHSVRKDHRGDRDSEGIKRLYVGQVMTSCSS